MIIQDQRGPMEQSHKEISSKASYLDHDLEQYNDKISGLQLNVKL